MDAMDTVVRELRQILDAPRTAPEWRWNAHRRLVSARTALHGVDGLPTQSRGGHDDVSSRLGDLGDGVLDRLHAREVVAEVDDLLRHLEPASGQ